MSRKIHLLLIFFICIGLKIYSQKCAGGYDIGEHLINEVKYGTVCFKRDTEKRTDYIYYTKYTFKLEGDIYYLDFTFFVNENKLMITYTNQFNTKHPREINFYEKGPTAFCKDYKAHEENISKEEYYTILFGIPNILNPYVILYHFELMDDETIIFKTGEAPVDKLLEYNNFASTYVRANRPPPPPPAEDIKKLVTEINKYRNSVLAQLDKDDQTFIDEIWPKEASYELSQKFTNKLNTTFYNYYKNVFLYQDHKSRIEFKFICNADGNIDFPKNIQSINSLQIKWIEESFRVHIFPGLKKEVFETMNVRRINENLIDEYNIRFQARINNLNRNDPGVEEIFDIQKDIRNEFAKKMERSINIRTEFTYILKYESSVKDDIWEYKFIKSREIFRSLNSDEILTDELRSKFLNLKIHTPKKHKYNIKRCFVQINDEKPVQDIKSTD